MSPSIFKERLNLYLPRDLVEDLREHVPARERTNFVAAVLSRELTRLKLAAVIAASAGAWRDEDHPELSSPEEIEGWIEAGRTGLNWDRSLGDEE